MITVKIFINDKEIYSVDAVRTREMNPMRYRNNQDDRFRLREYKLSDGRTLRHWAASGANMLASRMIADGVGDTAEDLFGQFCDEYTGLSKGDRSAYDLGKRLFKGKYV